MIRETCWGLVTTAVTKRGQTSRSDTSFSNSRMGYQPDRLASGLTSLPLLVVLVGM
jgi:hypothetical protein